MEINRIDIKEQLRDARRQVESEYEQLWHRNNMRGDYNTALEQRKSLEFQERLKNILG